MQESGVTGCMKNMTVQNRVIRSFMGVHRYASNVAIAGDMGWVPSHNRRKLCMVNLWMPDHRLTKKTLTWDYNSGRVNTWSGDIKKIFSEVDMLQMYNDMSICDGSSLVTLKKS